MVPGIAVPVVLQAVFGLLQSPPQVWCLCYTYARFGCQPQLPFLAQMKYLKALHSCFVIGPVTSYRVQSIARSQSDASSNILSTSPQWLIDNFTHHHSPIASSFNFHFTVFHIVGFALSPFHAFLIYISCLQET